LSGSRNTPARAHRLGVCRGEAIQPNARNNAMNEQTHDVLIEWNDNLKVGVQEIDEQHKVLVDLANRMHAAIRTRHGSEEVEPILDELIQYTKVHFTVEESVMRVLDYPGYEHHKQQHEHLIERIQEMREKIREGKSAVSFELMHFLKMWLTEHILESDKRMAKGLLERGAKASWSNEGWVKRLFHGLAAN